MDPISAGLALFSFGLNAFGSYKQGQANQQAADYNANINMYNAALARQQGQIAADAQARDAKRIMGSMVANYGASGVQVDQGSPVDVLADSARMAALDNLTIRYNAEMQAQSYEQQAQLAKMGGQAASTAGTLGVLNAGVNALGFYNRYGTSSTSSTFSNNYGASMWS